MAVKMAQVQPDPKALATLVDLAAANTIKPIIGKVLAFGQFAEAHRLSERGHGRGKVVVRVSL